MLESEAAIKKLTKGIDKHLEDHGYPKTAIGKQFALLAHVLESRLKIVYLTIGGWDTHTGQISCHQQLRHLMFWIKISQKSGLYVGRHERRWERGIVGNVGG